VRVLVTVPWGQRLGGAEEMLQTLLAGAQDRGHEFEFVFFEPGPWPAQLSDAGFRVEVITAGRLRQAHRWVPTVGRLTKILRSRRPDVILNWIAKTHLYASPAAVLAGMADRVVLWQHAIPSHGWIDRLATLLPVAAIGCSSEEAARAQARLFPSRPVFVVRPGVPVPDTATEPAPLDLPQDVPVVGLVGRLQPWKGQDRLLTAQALLRDRGHRIHTVIVGGDAYGLSPEYAGSLASVVDRLGLVDAVTMTGQVADAEPYIDQMDILVNASDPEPFGIVLLEAMARGVAVVAVDSGGPGEFIEHGRTGQLARSGEPAALADALEPLLESLELRRDVARAGHELFLREFTDSALQERFFDQLEALVQGSGKDLNSKSRGLRGARNIT
jgi:glycosyltransferase involved in cell wall biosynthesis